MVQRAALSIVLAGIPPNAFNAPLPSTMGARKIIRRSTSASWRKAEASPAPPSTSRERTPRVRRARTACGRDAACRSSTPACSNAAAWVGSGAQQSTTTGTSRAERTRFESSGSRADVSKTTRSGGTLGGATPRTVSRGSSTSAVPMPTATASLSARSLWTSARAASPVSHPGRRVASVRAPSSERASLRRTKGRSLASALKKAAFSSRAADSSTPRRTSTPSPRSRSAPPRATGLGSGTAATTRRIPAARIASVHGGVFP